MGSAQHLEYARQELELVNEDPAIIDGYLQVLAAFDAMEHSGTSASIAIMTLNNLLQFKPLSPLTDDPDEWLLVTRGTWQSRRDPEAFSKDAGKTYTLISEVQQTKKAPRHETQKKGGI